MRRIPESCKKRVKKVVILIERNGVVSMPALNSLTRMASSLTSNFPLVTWGIKLKSPWCG